MGKQTPHKYLPLLCVAAGILFSAAAYVAGGQGAGAEGDGALYLERNAYGEGGRTYQWWVEGLGEEPMPVTLEVDAIRYGDDEIEEVFDSATEYLGTLVLGNNPSAQEIREDLYFPASLDTYGLRVQWFAQDGGPIDDKGHIDPNAWAEGAAAPIPAQILARLFDEAHSREATFDFMVYPPNQTQSERLLAEYYEALEAADREARSEQGFWAPRELGGKTLSLKTAKKAFPQGYALFGALLGALLYFREKQGKKDADKLRRRQLQMDYAQITSKLMIFIGAGLSVRKAMEQMVAEHDSGGADGAGGTVGAYRVGRTGRAGKVIKAGKAGKSGKSWKPDMPERFAYAEARVFLAQVSQGIPERAALEAFGLRCGLPCYRKLCALLEQYVQTGNKQLRFLLEEEVRSALEMRKQLALRAGEEAGTKLMAPLMLLLVVVMGMVMVPALWSMM
ncbi:MAG: hypothetical protein LBR77_00950 [Lachnospiraceae bacterium]|nr:hypothetical protein [Lachnospiraceae bacterium]